MAIELLAQVKATKIQACDSYRSDESNVEGFKTLGNLDISYMEIAVAADNHRQRLLLLALNQEDGPLGALVDAINEAEAEAGLSISSAWERAEQGHPEAWRKGLEGQQKLNIFCGVE